MTVYPFELDSDVNIISINDNINELGGEAIQQLRAAMFAVQAELGIKPSGSVTSVSARLDKSLNPDGSIKTSALTSIGLVTLPITDNHISNSAGIKEYKLSLDYSTSDLNTLIVSNTALLNSLNSFVNSIDSDLSTHIGGGALLSDGSFGRHVASHIDLNNIPNDIRDVSFNWSGLLNKDGILRTATNVASALLEINNDFVSHQNAINNAHLASSVVLDTSNFEIIPISVDNVQKLADHLDDFEVITVGKHLATQHANGIPLISRSQGCNLPDGYKENVVPSTSVITYLVTDPNNSPVDDISTGDNVIKFLPDNSNNIFDSQFSQVRVGDVITVNYGTGFETSFLIDSIRYIPGIEWVIRINGYNYYNSDGYAYARIDKPLFDRRTEGVLAVASANATPIGSFDNFISSLIVAHPRGAMAIGFGFDPGQLDENHYNLYLEMYPTGNPIDKVIQLPAIDVTGDLGSSVGTYTVENVVKNINNKFREIGFNYRFIAFSEKGNVGIMLADAINCVSFAIIKGSNSSGTLVEGTFTNNIIGEASGTNFDALGFGSAHADIASPSFISSFVDVTAAQNPTKVISPLKNRDYVVNGRRRDSFAPTWNATIDKNGYGYWDGYISARNEIGSFTIETTYTIDLDLKAAGLKPGKTIVIQPAVDFSDSFYFDVDYGRFIIKSVNFEDCPGAEDKTQITVINSVHGTGNGFSFTSGVGLPVKVYFSYDSVSFNNENVINQTPTSNDYHRFHEVFINDRGETFSHERARLPIQNGSGFNLDTNNWHLKDVSSKLRGYRDNFVTFNKYLRFYVLNYDDITGEYDGYLGKRIPTNNNIINTGPITKGRKNVVTRFYDETYSDYIDLFFDETSSSLGTSTNILTGPSPRYVDIEIFDSLREHDNILLLATTEVSWKPPSGQNIINNVVNRRQFGSIDEEDLTQSVIDFITSGDRSLHANGIIRGFDFDFINSSDNREIFYKGGASLVNGKVLIVNNQSVTIPEILEDGYSTPTTVDWAVCVNEKGEFEPIILTSSKKQFFAKDNNSSNTYYVPSVTFNELINIRKDLTPFSIVTANIASITINSGDVLDIRRFVGNQDLIHPLTLSGEDFVGNFNSFESVINWIKRFGKNTTSIVKVRGEFDIDSPIDLRDVLYPVSFEGDGAVINITSSKGFILGTNVSFKNIDFKYTPNLSLPSNNYINSNNGCIYYESISEGLTKSEIIGCNFISNDVAARPPFISFELNNNDLVRNVFINQNTFSDTLSDGYMSAIAIVANNTGVSSEPALLVNSVISNNRCLQRQGIFITSSDTSGVLDTPGLSVQNVTVSGNICGVIGYLISSNINNNYRFNFNELGNVKNNFLNIKGNSCHFIGNSLFDGLGMLTRIGSGDGSNITYGLGNVIISENNTNWIYSQSSNDSSSNLESTILINKNNIRAFNHNYLNNIINNGLNIQHGLRVDCFKSDDINSCIISENNLDGYYYGEEHLYSICIFLSGSGKIINNNIKGMSGFGIAASTGLVGSSREYIITGNTIKRDNRNITAYIAGPGSDDFAFVNNNILDNSTINGTSTDVIIGNSNWIIERNRNQTASIELVNVGWVSANAGVIVRNGTSTTESIAAVSFSYVDDLLVTGQPAVRYLFNTTDSTGALQWIINLNSILPIGVRIIDATVVMTQSLESGSDDTGFLRLSEGTTSLSQASGVIPQSPSILTLNLTDDVNYTTPAIVNNNNNRLRLEASMTVAGSSSSNFSISSIILTYRY